MAQKKQEVGIEVVRPFNTQAQLATDGSLIDPVFYEPRLYPNPDRLLQLLANQGNSLVIDLRTDRQREVSMRRIGRYGTVGLVVK